MRQFWRDAVGILWKIAFGMEGEYNLRSQMRHQLGGAPADSKATATGDQVASNPTAVALLQPLVTTGASDLPAQVIFHPTTIHISIV